MERAGAVMQKPHLAFRKRYRSRFLTWASRAAKSEYCAPPCNSTKLRYRMLNCTPSSYSHRSRAPTRQHFMCNRGFPVPKSPESSPRSAHPVLTPWQYHSLNSWLEWTSQNDWSYCYVLFLHFQMPAIKQNELIYNPIQYVNAQLPKLFCSLFRFL